MTPEEATKAYYKARKRYQNAPIGSDAEKEAYKEMTELISKVPEDKRPKPNTSWV